jgi:hypothetical protein
VDFDPIEKIDILILRSFRRTVYPKEISEHARIVPQLVGFNPEETNSWRIDIYYGKD